MCHIEDETGSIEAGKCADLLVVNGDVAADIHVLNTDNMDVIMKDGWIVEPAPSARQTSTAPKLPFIDGLM